MKKLYMILIFVYAMFTTSCSRNRINQIPVDEAFIKSFNEVRVLHDPGLIYMNRDDVTHLPL